MTTAPLLPCHRQGSLRVATHLDIILTAGNMCEG